MPDVALVSLAVDSEGYVSGSGLATTVDVSPFERVAGRVTD